MIGRLTVIIIFRLCNNDLSTTAISKTSEKDNLWKQNKKISNLFYVWEAVNEECLGFVLHNFTFIKNCQAVVFSCQHMYWLIFKLVKHYILIQIIVTMSVFWSYLWTTNCKILQNKRFITHSCLKNVSVCKWVFLLTLAFIVILR